MKTALALAVVGLLLMPALSHAQTVITNDGQTTPTITSPSVGAFFGYDGGDYDSNQGFTNQGTDPGETFLTLNTAPTYNLNSITLQQSAGSSFNASSDVFTLGVFSVSGSTLTSLGTENYVFNGTAPGASGYFTLNTSALGLVLNANTEYAFSFSNGPGNGDYLGLVSSRSGAGDTTTGDNSYSNGEAIIDATPTAAGNTETLTPALDSGNTYDRAFSVDLSAVPEPSTWAMMLGSLGVLVGLQHLRRRAL